MVHVHNERKQEGCRLDEVLKSAPPASNRRARFDYKARTKERAPKNSMRTR